MPVSKYLICNGKPVSVQTNMNYFPRFQLKIQTYEFMPTNLIIQIAGL